MTLEGAHMAVLVMVEMRCKDLTQHCAQLALISRVALPLNFRVKKQEEEGRKENFDGLCAILF